MAIATMSLTGVIDGETKTISRSASLDDAVMPYFFAFYRSIYGQVETGKTDENGQSIMRDMTDEETFAKYATGISQGTVANVQNYVREIAAKQAAESVPTIEAVPHND